MGEAERWFFTVAAGLAMGSFASVLLHRLPRRESLLYPRSCCPTCRHPLAPGDMVPVLSYLFLRGRCRYCRAPISLCYPLLEAGTATVAVAAGAAGGLAATLAAVLLWCALIAFFSRRPLRDERGSTMVEMLAAAAILTLVLAPVTEAILALRTGPKAAHYRGVATNIARSKADELHAKYLRSTLPSVPSGPYTEWDPYGMTGYVVEWWFREAPDISGGTWIYSRKLVIRVTCPDCESLYGSSIQDYWLITVIRRSNGG